MTQMRGKCTQKSESRAGVIRAGLMHRVYNWFLLEKLQGNGTIGKLSLRPAMDSLFRDDSCMGHRDMTLRILAKSGHFVPAISWHS